MDKSNTIINIMQLGSGDIYRILIWPGWRGAEVIFECRCKVRDLTGEFSFLNSKIGVLHNMQFSKRGYN